MRKLALVLVAMVLVCAVQAAALAPAAIGPIDPPIIEERRYGPLYAAGEHYVGWVVGGSDSGYGAIFRSVDGGATWTRQGSPATVPDVMLEAVAAIDPLTCWVVGETAGGYGTILRTEDGGATWTRQGSPATIPDVGMAKISALDRNTAWVVGTPGVILFTADGGRTWAQKQTADIPPVLLQGVYALDADNVWVTGDVHNGYGTIFRTSDGGATWVRKGSSADVSHSALLDVHAVDEDTAWIACQGGAAPPTLSLLKTEDNGATWTGQVLGSGFFDTNSVTTIGENVVWATTDADGIYRSDNAKDFVQQEAAEGKYDYYLVSICALDENTAWAAGPAGGGGGPGTPAGIVERTTDGGQTWVSQMEIDIALHAVSFVHPSAYYYFAEGSFRPGFETYLCIANPGDQPAEVDIHYMKGDGAGFQPIPITVPPASRVTVPPSSGLWSTVDEGQDFGMVVNCTNGRFIVAERPMYFDYKGKWTGGSCVVGAAAPSSRWYFAEGYTGPGFEEWICVLNPGFQPADLTFRFQTQSDGEKVVGGHSVPPRSRGTFSVNDLLGAGYECSLALESSSPVVAERPMYFDYSTRLALENWNGGHCVMGATAPSKAFYFAEGTTREGFEEWLTIQNPGDTAITVDATYHFATDGGDPVTRSYDIEPGYRHTVFVPEETGAGRDVSVQLTSDAPFLAERPMYFEYTAFGADGWTGGHCVIGAPAPAGEWFFAEGYTGDGFQEWLTLYNPGDADAQVELTYYTQEEGELPVRSVIVPARTRINVYVNESAGLGYQLSCRVKVTSGPGIVAERPMYFNYGPGWTGGHVVVGYAPWRPI